MRVPEMMAEIRQVPKVCIDIDGPNVLHEMRTLPPQLEQCRLDELIVVPSKPKPYMLEIDR